MQTFRVIFKDKIGRPHSLTVQASSRDVAWKACQEQYPQLMPGRLIKVV